MRNRREIDNLYVYYRISDGAHKVQKCATKIESLKNATKVFKDAKLIIYTDGLGEETTKAILELCDKYKNITFKKIDCRGNSMSFRYIYEEAIKLNDSDFVYFLEDDYLHVDGSCSLLKEAAENNFTDYITLYDHPDKYELFGRGVNPYCRDFGEKTILFRTPSHHWKLTNSTTMTFGAFVDVLKRDKGIFWKYTQNDIPSDFSLFLELSKEDKLLSSPIPSLSTHCDLPYLAPIIDWEEVKKEENEVDTKKDVCIVMITHKEKLESLEEKSFIKAFETFKNRDIKIVIPNHVKGRYFDEFKTKYGCDIIKVNDEWLKSSESYNNMCCNVDFYKLFTEYNYILIYQSDCWVFEDRLDFFMSLGYDWYGAPWPHLRNISGNGGLSLRKTSKMLEICQKYKYNRDTPYPNEDTWFCITHANDLKCCDLKNACNFSFECVSQRYFTLMNDIPMGLHGHLMEQCWDNTGDKFREFKKKYS